MTLTFIEEGLPLRGILNICYYSGEGNKRRGCAPLPKFRKSLLYLGLIDEEEIVEEEHRVHSIDGQNLHESLGVSTHNYEVGLKAIKLELGMILIRTFLGVIY